MLRVRLFFHRIGEYFRNLPFKSYVNGLLTGIGLFANLIAIATFFGAVNTPKESPNFYINSQEFLVWSLISVVYGLGLISAKFKRRWRQKMLDSGYEDFELDVSQTMFTSTLRRDQFSRDFCLTLLVVFPLFFLYMRALQTAASESSQFSPWLSLWATALFCIPITLFMILVSNLFDKALSLFADD